MKLLLEILGATARDIICPKALCSAAPRENRSLNVVSNSVDQYDGSTPTRKLIGLERPACFVIDSYRTGADVIAFRVSKGADRAARARSIFHGFWSPRRGVWRARKTGGALAVFHEVQRRRETEYIDAYYVAVLLEALGEHDQAFEESERARREGSYMSLFTAVNPKADGLKLTPDSPAYATGCQA